MKNLFVLLYFLLFAVTMNGQGVTIETLRKEYYKVSTDSITCGKLYDKVENLTSTDNLINGYKGAITAAMANHVKSKAEKLKLFNSGKKLIEAAIKADAQNVELRFLRFTIQ